MAGANFKIAFIDPLFAVAVHIGFIEGIMQEQWFKDWHIPKGDDAFNLFVFGLGFLTIVLSWLGYHESIEDKPLKSIWRFFLDVSLVSLYAVLLVKFKNFGAVLFLLTSIYLLYIFWDIAKVKEYKPDYNGKMTWQKYRRELTTSIWCIAFAILLGFHISGTLTPVPLLILAYVSTGLYRINKNFDIWGTIWDALYKTLLRMRK